MREHHYRRQIIEEMHLRRWPGLAVPSSVFQILRTVDPGERADERGYIEHGLIDREARIAPDVRHYSGAHRSGLRFAWERHTEGSSITLFAAADAAEDAVRSARRWIEEMPGAVVRATHINLVENEVAGEALVPEMEFKRSETVSCRIAAGIRMWSDFRLHASAFGRLLVSAGTADPATLSRKVQQLQELGNYRNMALLGLPEVREQWQELDAIEERLREFSVAVSDRETRDDMLLEQVSDVSRQLAALDNSIGYRLNATQAYATLVSERLGDLAAQPVDGFASLDDFTRRRLAPAVRTCSAHRARLDQLMTRAANLTALLRARIETRIENQNASLLRSMERRATMQLRLQQLVEGLSIFAITYYGVGLIAYVVKALDHVVDMPSPDIVLGISIPVVMVTIWLVGRWVKRRVLGDLEE